MANKLWDQITGAVGELTNLEVLTVVGPVNVKTNKDSGRWEVEAFEDGGVKAMYTRINMVEGDICNTLDEAFVSGDYQQLREFHTAQVEKGNDTIVRNVKLLVDLAGSIASRFEDEGTPGAGAPTNPPGQ